MTYFTQILFLIATYLVASIPFGLILTKKALGKDVRAEGSGNIGATNVVRVGGKKLGALTLILDGLKGVIMIILARFTFPHVQNLHLLLVLVSAVAVIGHIFPIYLKFKGGKGVATTIAVLLTLDPAVGALTAVIWIAVFVAFRTSAISSLTSILSATFLSYYFDAPESQLWLCFFLLSVITLRHHENIKRLISGQENKF